MKEGGEESELVEAKQKKKAKKHSSNSISGKHILYVGAGFIQIEQDESISTRNFILRRFF